MKASALPYVAVAAAAAVAGYVVLRGAKEAKGLVTGDNAITRGATDADGKPVTAYVGVPVLGTLGAATNAASGGYLASFGSWLGGKAFDLFNTTADLTAPTPVTRGGQASYDETDRLLARHPAPFTGSPDSIFNPSPVNTTNGQSWSQLAGLDGSSFDFLTGPIRP